MPVITEHDALRADIYRLLARLVHEAPNEGLLDFLTTLEVNGDSSELRPHWVGLSLAASKANLNELERAHFRHLVGVIQGELLPYASWYLTGSLMEMPLVELRRDLRELGYERTPGIKEPEDNFAALCEVMAMLIETDSPQQEVFFYRHLATWSLDFMADLSRVDTPFYAAVGQLGQAFLSDERARLSAPGELSAGTPVPIRIKKQHL